VTRQMAVCNAVSVHFGRTIRRNDIQLRLCGSYSGHQSTFNVETLCHTRLNISRKKDQMSRRTDDGRQRNVRKQAAIDRPTAVIKEWLFIGVEGAELL